MRRLLLAVGLLACCAVAQAQFIGGMSGLGGGKGLGGGNNGAGVACAGNLVLDYTNACNLMTQMTGF